MLITLVALLVFVGVFHIIKRCTDAADERIYGLHPFWWMPICFASVAVSGPILFVKILFPILDWCLKP
jgi:hypothetical protein